eukprot:Hpha_TRINITY_DN35837_c0_g1::TRINITY_DN35837_c0_g1_i1::g.84907::m.84907
MELLDASVPPRCDNSVGVPTPHGLFTISAGSSGDVKLYSPYSPRPYFFKNLLWRPETARLDNELGRIWLSENGPSFPLPEDKFADLIGVLRSIADKTGVCCNIRDTVKVHVSSGPPYAELNGCRGRVIRASEQSGRWVVRCPGVVEELQPDERNLRVVDTLEGGSVPPRPEDMSTTPRSLCVCPVAVCSAACALLSVIAAVPPSRQRKRAPSGSPTRWAPRDAVTGAGSGSPARHGGLLVLPEKKPSDRLGLHFSKASLRQGVGLVLQDVLPDSIAESAGATRFKGCGLLSLNGRKVETMEEIRKGTMAASRLEFTFGPRQVDTPTGRRQAEVRAPAGPGVLAGEDDRRKRRRR